MLKATSIIIASAVTAALTAAAVVTQPGPPPADLLADIAAVQTDIKVAEAEAAQTSGLLGVEANLRLRVLRSTEAMLEQRRLGFLRRIQIVYRDDAPGALIPPEEVARIEKEIAARTAELSAAEAEASRYSGGLLQVMALVQAATAKATLATLHQQQTLARHGIPIPNLAAGRPAAAEAPRPPGKPTSDREALQ